MVLVTALNGGIQMVGLGRRCLRVEPFDSLIANEAWQSHGQLSCLLSWWRWRDDGEAR